MDIINPLAGSLLQSTQVQRQQSAIKQRQIRRTQALQKDVTARDDEMEHQVESSEELPSIHDEDPRQQEQKQRKRQPQDAPKDDEPPRLDLTA